MRFVLLLTVFVLSSQLFGQYDFCDSLVVHAFDQTMYDTTGLKNTVDYVARYFPDQVRYVSNRYELEPINLWVNYDSMMLFIDSNATVRIYFDIGHVDVKDIFYPKSENESYSGIREYNPGMPYGIGSEDTSAVFIKEIRVNGIKLPEDAFSDLLNPNRYETNYSIKPLAVYWSNNKKYIYIYIFGALNKYIRSIDEAEAFALSYMAKLILTDKGYYVGRIVIPGERLFYFGFFQCPYFIGF